MQRVGRMRHALALLACISLSACFSSHDFRFGWAHHEDGLPTRAGWDVAVEDDGTVKVSTWTTPGAEVTLTGTLNPAGRSALAAIVDPDGGNFPTSPLCYYSQTPCTSYELRYIDPDGLDDEVFVKPPGLVEFVDALVAEVPTGTSRYVDGIH
jgi:hypothetical protein